MMAWSVVMVGDSITDSDRPRHTDGLGDGWVSLAAAELRRRGDDAVVFNRGVSGDRVQDLRARWRADVIDLHPAVLTVLVGVNEAWRRYEDGDPVTAEAFEADYRAILAEAAADSAPRLILMEPFLTAADGSRAHWREDLDPKRAVVARIAADLDAMFVPLQSILDEAAKVHGAAALAPDSVHPSALGTQVLARAWLTAYDRL
ncbi:SGNH/GDSL hydrolase family protein [Oryzihumus sp.]|uniref:SGNH/GDSL hydrolase family protein n=1 Tax=Oryzihumus sp. TaxID=1968903 RepID=UPI002EDB8E34